MEEVEGPWKQFEFKFILSKDHQDVLDHLRKTFYLEEPINKAVGKTADSIVDSDRRIKYYLEFDMSFMAIDARTQKIAGVLIIIEFKKDSSQPVFPIISPATEIIRDFIQTLEGSVNIFETYGVDRFAENCIISVDKEFGGLGLATEMYRRSLPLLKVLGYKVVTTSLSNPKSQAIGAKFGFQEIARVYFTEAVDESGQRTIPAASPEQHLTLNVLQF